MTGLTDIHSHFVYGVDDGARTFEDMTALLAESRRQGVTRIYGTSHETPGMAPFPLETYQAHLAEARAWCRENAPEMQLLSGAELLYTPAMDDQIWQRKLRTLEGTDFVLVEFVPDVEADEIVHLVEMCGENGYEPILAHIERYACMRGGFPARLKERFPVRFQVNGKTVLSPHGLPEKLRVRRWLRQGLVDHIASDMHRLSGRPPNLGPAFEHLRQETGGGLASLLCGGF